MNRILGAVIFSLTLLGCAGRIPLPVHLQSEGLDSLTERMVQAHTDVRAFVGEARLTYFGEEGRVRVTATLAVARPGKFRYEILGPHGAAVEAFATDGASFQVLKLVESRFLYGPATPDNFDQLLAFAPLHLDSTGWVGLLLGEVPIPPEAVLNYDSRAGRFVITWHEPSQSLRLEVDPVSARLVRLAAFRDQELLSDVHIEARDARGLPSVIRMQAPVVSVDLHIKLRDIEYDPAFDSDTFVIDPPSGVVSEYLGPVVPAP